MRDRHEGHPMFAARVACVLLTTAIFSGCGFGAPTSAEASQAVRDQLREQFAFINAISGGGQTANRLSGLAENARVIEIDCTRANGQPGYVCAYTWVSHLDGRTPDTPQHSEARFVKTGGQWYIAKR
jgi:hypothetical protein